MVTFGQQALYPLSPLSPACHLIYLAGLGPLTSPEWQPSLLVAQHPHTSHACLAPAPALFLGAEGGSPFLELVSPLNPEAVSLLILVLFCPRQRQLGPSQDLVRA